jgi:3-dehydroquinate synthase
LIRRSRSASDIKRVHVPIPGRAYSIWIGPGALEQLGDLLERSLPSPDLLVISDARVFRHHGARLRRSLGSRFRTAYVQVPPGERTKSVESARRLYERCAAHGIGRDGAIVAFGGGVVGDLAGYVAATWLRGVNLVMVPTTLLAQVDSSVGGKVGVNLDGLKNLVGAFHQPRLVLSDTSLLSTLPRRELRSALAEVVKYGMIADLSLFRLLERELDAILAGDPALLSRIVRTSCRIKARIVTEDEREAGLRQILNYGHTLGHAIEAEAAGRLSHGEAVALGMRGAASISHSLGILAPEDRARQDRLLDRIGLPAAAEGLPIEGVLRKLKADKKVRNRQVRFVLTSKVGSARFAQPVDNVRVRRALAALLT